MTDLVELLERVKAATGPDREIDAAIFERWGEGYLLWDLGEPLFFKRPAGAVRQTRYDVPSYTASVDEALALNARLLPGWVVGDLSQNSRHAGDPWGCQLNFYSGSNPLKNQYSASGHDFQTAPLAILAALLSALIAQNANK